MLSGLSNSVFLESESISLTPVVSAEWNQNLFNQPHITTAGNGSLITPTLSAGSVSDVTSGGKANFTTKKFDLVSGAASITYTKTGLSAEAYKIITYIKTNSPEPVIINISAKGTDQQFGSRQEEASSLGWTRVVTYIGSTANNIETLTYKINANCLSGSEANAVTVMFTVPEIYETTYFDYQNNSLWPTEAPFTNFRPGESYIGTGNALQSFPTNYRKITKHDLNSTDNFYSPITSIIQNPTSIINSPDVPLLKNALASSNSPFKYFVSDSYSPIISAVYEKDIYINKIVIKLNTLITTPVISVALNGTTISVDGSTSITMPANSDDIVNGVLVLYKTSGGWTKTKWSTMPKFTDQGSLTNFTSINKITVSQISATPNDYFAGYTSSENLTSDFDRMHVVEISPRLEIDLSDLVQEMSIDKSLDEATTNLPISGINSNTASVTLSGIPFSNNGSPVLIFSSENSDTPNVLSGMLRRGIKIYLGYKVTDYSILSSGTTTGLSAYIPAGTYYTDNWNESDIQTISLQGYDTIRFLQYMPVSDYVSNGRAPFDVISDTLELSGFTDYDNDSLYEVCNDKAFPFDIYYYSAYSKDTTVVGSLNELLTPYQIAAYVDEYGIIKFKSLNNILTNRTSVMDIRDTNIIEGGYSIQNKPRPGKISIKYAQPRTKQSPSAKMIQSSAIRNSTSSIYVTSNDILWEQQKIDAVGFNYVDSGIDANSTTLVLNKNDQKNIFNAYNIDASGYVLVEDEIMSFEHKEYELKTGSTIKNVVAKNDLELQSALSKFIKYNNVGLRTPSATITAVSGNGTLLTYTAINDFKENDYVTITEMTPEKYNTAGYIYSVTSTSFSIRSTIEGTATSSGIASGNGGYDMEVTPTGKILNVKRGMFGTPIKAHTRISNLASKNLKSFFWDFQNNFPSASSALSIIDDNQLIDSALPSIKKIKVTSSGNKDIVICPDGHSDPGYQTYSVKFELPDNSATSAGLVFNCAQDYSEFINIMLVRFNTLDPKTGELYVTPKYKYFIKMQNENGSVAWADVTGVCDKIVSNALVYTSNTLENNKFKKIKSTVFNLQAATYVSDGSDGEDGSEIDPKNIVKVYLNGTQVTGWQISSNPYDENTNPEGNGWQAIGDNLKTGLSKSPSLDLFSTYGKIFGFETMDTPTSPTGLVPEFNIPTSTSTHVASLLEIHATVKPLLSRSVSYVYQDLEFLNGILENRPMALEYPTYIMQTTPESRGINIYDVEYGTPAAVTALHSDVEYMWRYLPEVVTDEEVQYQKTLVDEYSLAYSTLKNTGHRGQIAIANNSNHIVYIKKDADKVNNFAINFTMWTNEAIVPSDPELIEKIIDIGNASETIQIDTKWIQSKDAAYKIMKILEFGITGFSKDITLNIFGNPLIQVGDIVDLTYTLKGITQQKCIVTKVSHSFSNGLATNITLNKLEE